jgi:hypothetical protein
MTDQATQTRPSKEGLFVTDAELIRRSGLPEKYMRKLILHLDGNKTSGFPKKLPLYGDRRYWPAVKAFFDRTAGHRMGPSQGGSDD